MPKGERKTEIAKARIGEVFGLLTIIEWLGSSKDRKAVYRFVCLCGNQCIKALSNVKVSGQYASCGCSSNVGRVRHHMKHGGSMRGAMMPEYKIWQGMRSRCEQQNNKTYNYYGGKGVSVCERWKDFGNFISDMGRRPSADFEIDRIDHNGNYEPGNCRWLFHAKNTSRSARLAHSLRRNILYPVDRVAHIQSKLLNGVSMKSISRDESMAYTTVKWIKAGAFRPLVIPNED